ncbi:LOW QUALITY PROTEIN: M-phase phosphoprotein 9 [Melanotaenia boesemani]|uniref:LOW QUALITY PROTEIN: M-phase phosphoprotein 9 n=1 Tax=Melanotaenia boesemani TaxID=1250792 RepID=UPI001C0408B7|nr:LOW QUALITY PROTEIN: M-phase phosphoprotein 9 [Melanotaenia boesemani]
MSTDDSISEDVSSSGALSHCHVSPDGDVGKESETSLVSSEGTSASGLAVSEEKYTTSQTTGGTVERRPLDITPACNKIRSLCLSTDEAFDQGKNLPFINPSSLETLRALVQEIQSSGETDPEIWKDCEGRWLHLFQLVEKQYQEQILAQQEQYQCQIQLIQDEIKALVQLQNRQASVQPHTEFSPTLLTTSTTDTKDYIFPLIPSGCTALKNVPSDNDSLAAPVHTPFSSPSPPLPRSEAHNQGEERATTVLSSGYGTLSAWETGLELAESPGGDVEDGQDREKHQWSGNLQEVTETAVIGCQQEFSSQKAVEVNNPNPLVYQQKTPGTSQQLTSWAQRQKLKPKKSKAGQASPQIPEDQGHLHNPRTTRQTPQESTDSLDQHRAAGLSSIAFPLRRSDSLMSEASGLTYWRLNECELYHPLPDSFDSDAYLLLQEASMSLSQEPRLSLREIYQNKQKDCKQPDWDCSVTSSPLLPQVLTLDPAANTRQSDRTSGFTSPSHFSSPSFAAQPLLYPRVRTPVTPDSMVECSPNPGDTDCISDSSSLSAVGPFPTKVQRLWETVSQSGLFTSQDKNQPSHTASRAGAPLASEEEGSNTHTSTLKHRSASGASQQAAVGPHVEKTSSLEDPVVLSLLRQNLREKHSRHVADLKAYYESEIQILREKLKLRDLPEDLEKSNQTLTERCKHLEKALADATSRIQELEATNSSLEKKLAEWPERYAVAGATVKSLQQRLEESKHSGKEKDALAARLKTRVRQLEEVAQKACTEADEREARREREYKMLQDLLGEYDSLMKEHEAVKNNLVSAENKLFDANDHISELKRVVSKLESQVKQLEHENQARARYASHSNTQPSGAGLFHHPDLLLSPSKSRAEPDVTRRKSPCSLSDQLNGCRKPQFSQTSQSGVHKRSAYLLKDPSSGAGSSVDASSAGGSWRCPSPPECEQILLQTKHLEQTASQREAGRREGTGTLTPMMRALIELEETKATEARAPWCSHQRTTVGLVERRHKELIQERAELLQAEKEATKSGGVAARAERGGLKSHGEAEKTAALLKVQRSLSPEGHRSSSLPPPAHRNIPSATPTKRETLLMPMSAKSSPKRCPTENYSTAFGHLMPREEHLLQRVDGLVENRRHSFHSSSPRKRLQFTSADRDDLPEPESSGSMKPLDSNSQLGWDKQQCAGPDLQDSCEDSALLVLDRSLSLSEAERLFDELTQEKLQIEAALSRMPGAGGRVTLQTRLDEVALENRLERLNRDLGSIRMTLKRFHVLRSSANI